MIVRLYHWAFRVPVLPLSWAEPHKLRPPTFVEAWYGISNT